MYEKAPEAKAHIDEVAHEIADATGGSVHEAPPKGKDRAQEKIDKHYAGDASKLSDLVRNTIVVPHESRGAAIKALAAHPDLYELKHIKPTEDTLGFGGTIGKLKAPNGVKGEIQLNTPEMIYAKEPEKEARKALGNEMYDKIKEATGMKGGEGHKIYEQYRALSNPQSEEAKALAEKSKVYYTQIVKLWQKNK